MGIINSVSGMIQRYGSSVTINRNGAQVQTKAFVEPLRYKNKIYIGGRQHPIGMYNNEKYLYIGKPEHELFQDESVVEAGGGKYIVRRCEVYRVQDIPVYVWAIMTRFGEKSEDEYDADSD